MTGRINPPFLDDVSIYSKLRQSRVDLHDRKNGVRVVVDGFEGNWSDHDDHEVEDPVGGG